MTTLTALAAVVVLLAAGGVVDREDAPEPTPERIERSVMAYSIKGSVELLVVEAADEKTLTLGSDVLFAFGSAELDGGARAALEKLLADLPDGASVTVDGHTDSRGGDGINIPLSQERAQAVADVIAGQRPDVAIVVAGHGSSAPLAEEYPGGEADFDAMATNRRVEIRVAG